MLLAWMLHPSDHSYYLRLVLITWLQNKKVDFSNIGIPHGRNFQTSNTVESTASKRDQGNHPNSEENKQSSQNHYDVIQISDESSNESDEYDIETLAKIISDEIPLKVSLNTTPKLLKTCNDLNKNFIQTHSPSGLYLFLTQYCFNL